MSNAAQSIGCLTRPVSILVVDDHGLIRDSVNVLFSREHDCNIVAQVSTQSQVYTLTVGYREGNRTVEDLYFGATVKSRRMRAGETWRRGRDLHDGKFTEACWHRILADILSCELVKYQSNEWKGQYGWERPAANESGAV